MCCGRREKTKRTNRHLPYLAYAGQFAKSKLNAIHVISIDSMIWF